MVYFDKSVPIKQWFALHTRCHHEKQITMRLETRGLETFLPVRTVQRRWKDRKKLIEFPLFPGYVFIHMSILDKRQVVQTPGVVKIVGAHRPEPVSEMQIHAVRQFLRKEIEFDPYPYLMPGQAVEVRRGPLKHVRGVLVSKKNKHRLVINIDLINNSIATEIDAEDVQAL